MAKKKTDSTPAPSQEPKPKRATKAAAAAPAAAAPAADSKKGGKKAATPKAAGKKAPAAPAGPQAVPMIDTNLAAQAAAQMLLAKATMGGDAQAAPTQESQTFKNMKQQLAHPRPTGLGGLLGPAGDAKKSAAHNILGQQRGHNQTFSAANRTGVPRRTNG